MLFTSFSYLEIVLNLYKTPNKHVCLSVCLSRHYNNYIYIHVHSSQALCMFVANLQKKNVQWFPILLTLNFYCVKCETYMQLVQLQVFLF